MKTNNIKYYIEKSRKKKVRFNSFSDELATKALNGNLKDDHQHYYDIQLMEQVFDEICEIPAVEKFYYPIVFTNSNMMYSPYKEDIYIPKDILHAIKTGQCFLLIQSVQEGWHFETYINYFIQDLQTKFNIDDNQIILMTGNYLTHERYKTVPHSCWELGMPGHFDPTTPDHIADIRPYKYICLNRRHEVHRIAVAASLSETGETGILTVAKGGGYGESCVSEQLEEDFNNRFPELWDSYANNIKANLPLTYDDGIDPETTNPNWDPHTEKFHKSYLHIVTETNSQSCQLFFSEKMFKPIVHMQPFVLCGNYKSLEKLKEFGYKTFGQWIDESYDNEPHYETKIGKVNAAINQFIAKSPEELTELMQEMRPTFEHNLRVLRHRAGDNDKRPSSVLVETRKKLHNILN